MEMANAQLIMNTDNPIKKKKLKKKLLPKRNSSLVLSFHKANSLSVMLLLIQFLSLALEEEEVLQK